MINFYAIMNNEGLYLQKFNRFDKNFWNSDIKKAKLYRNIGPARAVITKIAQNNSNRPTLMILKFHSIEKFQPEEEVRRLGDVLEKKEKQLLAYKKYKLEEAKKAYKESQEQYLKRLREMIENDSN